MTSPLFPGVYVEEHSRFPPSVAGVPTAVPAFIGYTEKAVQAAEGDLRARPTRIHSLAEYERLFGMAQPETVTVTVTKAGATATAKVADLRPTYVLWHSVKLFFANGGGTCYIVSVGDYEATPAPPAPDTRVTLAALQAGLDSVAGQDEPTLIVVPEAVRLTEADYAALARAVLRQCATLKDRFAIFDALEDGKDTIPDAAGLERIRRPFTDDLRYGALYYPFIRTSYGARIAEDESNVAVLVGGTERPLRDWATEDPAAYHAARAALHRTSVVVPPSGAVAGVYAATDASRGVWKAPAGAALADVIEPVVLLDDLAQEPFTVDTVSGKSINVLRAFPGKGTLVWGARTLAGNDNEWRYVPVRRFFIMVEESVTKSTQWAVFEPNDANTWEKVRRTLDGYLSALWREGALAGTTSGEAFFVRCGVGSTMTSQDILEGRLIVEIGLAVVRPAEFVILRVSHQLIKDRP